ncbi:sigma-70 family RNA polymerase sigma factor [Streptomyces sp. NPDC058674]|uniref:sigma-70 family RNA polymerase sigma factor n=1 Tax=Streptomyces sp. NPDC058674 TaxID=3346592 RepID=UPI00364DD3CD
MNERSGLADRFEEHRSHLRAVAYRMLGSLAEAEDAVQEAWLRLDRSDAADIDNLGGWLTTVVARLCLNVLRARTTRNEGPLEATEAEQAFSRTDRTDGADPEHEALLAESVGLALLVVLDTLTPAERLAFVLHDLFAVPFEDIAPMIEKTPATTRQLASRARRRVRGREPSPDADLSRRRPVVDAFLAATRGGDFDALLSLLHPGVVLRADRAVGPTPEPLVITGAQTVARGAMAAVQRARGTQAALLDGSVGLVMAPLGRLFLVLRFTIADDQVTEIEVIAERERLHAIEIAVLTD